jgi:hypothetical protein
MGAILGAINGELETSNSLLKEIGRVPRVSRGSRPGTSFPGHWDSVLSITARGKRSLLHPSQPGEARSGGSARIVALEQLSRVCLSGERPGRA